MCPWPFSLVTENSGHGRQSGSMVLLGQPPSSIIHSIFQNPLPLVSVLHLQTPATQLRRKSESQEKAIK